jgi:hypothetical protein
MNSNPDHGEVYSIKHYVIKFVSDLRLVGWFSPGIPVSSTNKTDRHGIADILLKVALSTINRFIPALCLFLCQAGTFIYIYSNLFTISNII